MLQSIYDQMMDFYRNIEEEYGMFLGDNFDWEHVHFLLSCPISYCESSGFYCLPLSCCLSFVS